MLTSSLLMLFLLCFKLKIDRRFMSPMNDYDSCLSLLFCGAHEVQFGEAGQRFEHYWLHDELFHLLNLNGIVK